MVRRSKKLYAAVVEKFSRVGTTGEFDRFEICLVGTPECTWSSRYAGYIAQAVAK